MTFFNFSRLLFPFFLLGSFHSYSQNTDSIQVLSSDNKHLASEKILEATKNASSQKFVYSFEENLLIISTTGKKKPKHGTLGENHNISTAGYLKAKLNKNGEIQEVIFNNRSKAYCPSFVSLVKVSDSLKEKLGEDIKITLVNDPNPDCSGQ